MGPAGIIRSTLVDSAEARGGVQGADVAPARRTVIGSEFLTTRWTVVLAVQDADGETRREALSALCEAYWHPLYAFVRRRGHRPEDAADLTQAFFAHLIEKHGIATADPSIGRFRTFLLASLKNFLANQWDHDTARKRGGGWTRVPYDPAELEQNYVSLRPSEVEGRDDRDPEHLFDRQWAATVLERAVARLRAQQSDAGKEREFAVLSRFLTSDADDERPYREVAAELGMSDVAVRAAVHRLRQRLGAALRAEVNETVRDQHAADAELRHVLSLLV
jgi:RNA polymerase sigma-70 factor (ECF subfamily)